MIDIVRARMSGTGDHASVILNRKASTPSHLEAVIASLRWHGLRVAAKRNVPAMAGNDNFPPVCILVSPQTKCIKLLRRTRQTPCAAVSRSAVRSMSPKRLRLPVLRLLRAVLHARRHADDRNHFCTISSVCETLAS
eukprot:5635724-Pleurochrysis_carterae.AAC.2